MWYHFYRNLFRYPEEEDKKNSILKPLNAPQLPVQWIELNYISNTNGERLTKALGLRWVRKSRLSPLRHFGIFDFLRIIILMARNKDKINGNLKLFGEQEEIYGKFKT